MTKECRNYAGCGDFSSIQLSNSRVIKKSLMKNLASKIGALLIKPALKETLRTYDASQYGGAPLLGLKSLVMKMHGSSKEKEVYNSLMQCVTFHRQQIPEKIAAAVSL